jgi:hypothetical protein
MKRNNDMVNVILSALIDGTCSANEGFILAKGS